MGLLQVLDQSCPMREGVTPSEGIEVPIHAGQENKVLEQMANSGRGDAAKAQALISESSDPSCLHCPINEVGVGCPGRMGRFREGREEREVNQTLESAFCLRSRSSPGI